MQRIINYLSILIFVFCIATNNVFAQNQPKKSFQIQHWQTQNHVNVYFVKRPQIPMLDISIVFAAGSAYDEKNYGLASFTQAMIGEGTTQKTASQIAMAFDSIGAQFSGSANQDMAVFSLRTLTGKKYFTKAINTFTDVLTNANFPKKAFRRVKGQLLDAIAQNLQDPSTVATLTFYQNLYGSGPYGHPVLGTIDSVNKMSRDEVINFYHKYYVNRNARIVIVGAIRIDEAKALANQISNYIPEGKEASSLQMTKVVGEAKEKFVSMPVAQSTIIIGENGIRRQNKNYFDLIVANHILGGASLTSILFNVVRNQQGLVYGIYSGFSPLAARGPFTIWLQTRTSKRQDAINLVKKVLQTYSQKGPTANELMVAKSSIIGSFPIFLSTNAGIISNVINVVFYNLPLDYLQEYQKNIQKVTLKGVKDAFASQVKVNLLNTIIVGQKESNDRKKSN